MAFEAYSNQSLLGRFNPFPGLCMFLINFLEKLILIENIPSFHAQTIISNKNDFSILCQKIFFNCDDEALHSLYIFIFQNQLINLPCLCSNWRYWVMTSDSMSTLPRRWQEEFISLLMLPQFRKVYKEIYKLEKPLYETIVTAAMFRTRIIHVPEGMNGFTTTNLFIFIKHFAEINMILNKAGAFFTIVHELSNYLQRCKCSTLGESLQMPTQK